MELPKPGKYIHYKGKSYEVLYVARHSEDPDMQLVIYRALYESEKYGSDSIWARPLEMFVGEVEINGEKVPRFKLVED